MLMECNGQADIGFDSSDSLSVPNVSRFSKYHQFRMNYAMSALYCHCVAFVHELKDCFIKISSGSIISPLVPEGTARNILKAEENCCCSSQF